MPKTPKPSDSGAPALPPGPLLPVPPSKISPRPRAATLIPGLAAPPPGAKQARAQAAASRQAIERIVQQGQSLVTSLKAALTHHDASPDNAAEWQREGVDVTIVREFLKHEETLLSQFTAKAG